MAGTLSSPSEQWKSCIPPQFGSTKEVSSTCIPCVLTRTSKADKYSKLSSISTITSSSVGERGMGSVSVSVLQPQKRKIWYLVEWKGFSEDPERTTWEGASSLTKSPELVKDFHSLYPEITGPNTSGV
ncbi:hypothetical protein O181_044833 [Austropuccinia psidii MF-1]|uniref:Chromo domain-containing protein n=1 Tax=Austropuccinia psidii MF-1 TaxID=1389203 RepID=A0A9Q3HH03_9BASI|nr:hypothetical protein [Austropuccinia psidii MF-1]